MASTITNINWARVDQNVVSALRHGLPARDLFSMRALTLEESESIENDIVHVPLATDPTLAVKTLGTAATGTGSLVAVDVTLGNPKAVGWDAIEGKMSGQLFQKYWEDKIAGGMYVLAKAVLDAGLALVTKANFGDVEGTDKLTVAPADFGQADLGLLWQYGATKIKQRSRSLILNAAYAGQIIGNTSLINLFATASGKNAAETGILPMLIGHQTAAYPDMPANSESLGGAVFGQAAIALACAPISPLAQAGEGDIVDRRVITHAESGFSALYTMTAAGGGTIKGELALMYGAAKGQDSVVRIVNG
jgi:hypothetical protein